MVDSENQEDRLTVGAVEGALDALNVRGTGIEIDFKSAALPSMEGERATATAPSASGHPSRPEYTIGIRRSVSGACVIPTR
jgi:hypothetical protein